MLDRQRIVFVSHTFKICCLFFSFVHKELSRLFDSRTDLQFDPKVLNQFKQSLNFFIFFIYIERRENLIGLYHTQNLFLGSVELILAKKPLLSPGIQLRLETIVSRGCLFYTPVGSKQSLAKLLIVTHSHFFGYRPISTSSVCPSYHIQRRYSLSS